MVEVIRRLSSTFRARPSGARRPGGPSGSAGLSGELLDRVADRLALLALTYAILAFIAIVLIPRPIEWQAALPRSVVYLHGLFFVGVSLGLFALLKTHRIAQKHLAPVGLAYEVFGAFGIDHWILYYTGDRAFLALGLSWTALWIVMFPVLVPSTPLKTLIAATAAASVRPILVIVVALRGFPLPEFAYLAQFIAPTYLCIGVAVLVGHVVYGLGRDVTRARRMGSYRLVERLGVGGMGEVWRAEHQFLVRPAAIKLIRPDALAGPTGDVHLQRFEREVNATAQLRSPHTIEIYDFGITGDRTFYYVMELLDGLNLDQLVKHFGPLPVSRVIRILRQACHSLAEAHEQGLVHRDIKPANIFLCRHGRDLDIVKILDFGLVTSGSDISSEAQLTAHGSFFGTPAYAAPEMAMGTHDQLDGRTDIYSLGCVAYYLLTGQPVFSGPSPMAILMKHTSEEPDPPSRHSHEPIADHVEELVLRCLAKRPEERYPSAERLFDSLADLQEAHPWSREAAREWWIRHGSFSQEFRVPLATDEIAHVEPRAGSGTG